ncbi:hypothetical protein P1P75_10850 [Streptomyces sp. ID05-39B]|uniref:ATP-dependent DNA ligase n=1 Tax=Streptomyces sp. ID05-39B TaxID=3028664 RepID=UPI0029ADB893|nr:hypothetical protein [Streptomyces sp. ID05-39B]MDX3526928.1 hypothetical protein [Streptomyces sp. ID05-39B]
MVVRIDGELVVWEDGRLAFERLHGRLQRRGAGAARLAVQWPAHFVVFDLLRIAGTDTTRWPYLRRRAALAGLFAEHTLTAPWALCPSTTDPATVREWLTSWTAVGLEGVVHKRLEDPYVPSVRGWRKYKVRDTEEAVVGAITGPAADPRKLLLGRYDTDGRLRYVGRSTTLPQTAGRAVADLLAPAGDDHPWTGWSTGTAIHTLTGHTGQVRAVTWSPDGMQLATASLDHTVRIWDPATGSATSTSPSTAASPQHVSNPNNRICTARLTDRVTEGPVSRAGYRLGPAKA